MSATYDDAKLVVQLMRWGTEMGLDDALKEIASEGFDASDGKGDNPSVRKILFFGETVGSLNKHGVLDWELLTDLFPVEFMWQRVRAQAESMRQQLGDERLYEHFEALAAKVAQ